MDWIWAGLIVIAAAAFEAACAGRDPLGQLKAMKQPSWSPPTWAWVLIGIAWYAIGFVGLVRLVPLGPTHKAPVILLILLLFANAAANIPAFRFRRLDIAFLFLFPYWTLLAAFLWVVCPLDRLTCALFAIYSVYQLYAAAWAYELWRMNRTAG